ncbi:MAG TPA: VOC family protein [Puia sp.]|nr:VOC family protein [Puia sp.]
MQKITNLLMFDGRAEEAINFYISVFPNSGLLHITRYGPNEAGPEGSVVHASFVLYGQVFTCIDSYTKHAFTFTPSLTLCVNCETEDEVDDIFDKLTKGGKVLMPMGPYPFNKKFGWATDKFGVSWQVSLQPS